MGWIDIFRKKREPGSKVEPKQKTDWNDYFQLARKNAELEKREADRAALDWEQRKKQVLQASTERIRVAQDSILSVAEIRRELACKVVPDGYGVCLLLHWKNGDEFAQVHDHVDSYICDVASDYPDEDPVASAKDLNVDSLTRFVVDNFVRRSLSRK